MLETQSNVFIATVGSQKLNVANRVYSAAHCKTVRPTCFHFLVAIDSVSAVLEGEVKCFSDTFHHTGVPLSNFITFSLIAVCSLSKVSLYTTLLYLQYMFVSWYCKT